MKQTQFEQLTTISETPRTVLVKQLLNSSDRTLLYGYTCSRDTFHVYIKDEIFHKVIYNHEDMVLKHEQGATLDLEGIVPDKRLYPEACDFEFCSLLKRKGVILPFTLFDVNRPPAVFYGKITSSSNTLAAN